MGQKAFFESIMILMFPFPLRLALLTISLLIRQENTKSADLATQAMAVRPEAFEPYFFRAKAKHAQK